MNRRHLERVLRVFVDHENTPRPHRSLQLTLPCSERLPARDRWLRLGQRATARHEYSYTCVNQIFAPRSRSCSTVAHSSSPDLITGAFDTTSSRTTPGR